MNNVKLKIAVLSVAMFGMMSGVANAADMEGQSSVEIIRGISITPVEGEIKDLPGSGQADLYFGKVVSPTAERGAVLVVSPNGDYTAKRTTAIVDGHPATFKVDGIPGETLSIGTSNNTTMTSTTSDATLTATLTASHESVTTGEDGLAHFTVGGRLVIAQNQAAGIYEGVFTVTANY